MKKTPAIGLILIGAHALSACTWVKVDEHGLTVNTINPGEPPPAHCTHRGQVEVSVLDKVSFYRRDEGKVGTELEKLARNEAGLMDANLIQAVAKPAEGRQRFNVFHCP